MSTIIDKDEFSFLQVPYVALLEVYLFRVDDNNSDSNNQSTLPVHNPDARYKREESGGFGGQEEDELDLIEPLKNRAVLYSVPVALLALLLPSGWLFYRRVRLARDAARHWFAITPARSRGGASSAATGSNRRRLSYTQQLRAEEDEAAAALDGRDASSSAAAAVAFRKNGLSSSSEASTVRVGEGGDPAVPAAALLAHAQEIRPSAPSLPESEPPPYEPHYSEPKPHGAAAPPDAALYPNIGDGK